MKFLKNIINKMAKNKVSDADENATNEHDKAETTETVVEKVEKKSIKDAGAKQISIVSPKNKELKDDRFN